jgi:hypothetical protein
VLEKNLCQDVRDDGVIDDELRHPSIDPVRYRRGDTKTSVGRAVNMTIGVKMRGVTKTGAMKNNTLVIRATKVGVRKTGVVKTCVARTSEVPVERTRNSHGVLPRAPRVSSLIRARRPLGGGSVTSA